MLPFNKSSSELSVEEGCILWGNRVIVPTKGQGRVLHQLHEQHPGISRMKSIARRVVWWPGLDKDIEKTVKECPESKHDQNTPPLAPLHPWEWRTNPGHVYMSTMQDHS